MNYPLKIAFIWHMHQPYYKDLMTGEYLLPWVRLHATKDYYDMAAILDQFPGIRQTFNVVPSLLDQVEDYAAGKAKDTFLELSRKSASDLTEREKEFILCNFFLANWENMIKPYPRYWEILHKRGLHCSKEEIRKVVEYITEEEVRDLQVLFNLCWIDPSFLKGDPFLTELIKKGRYFSEEEKETLLEKQSEIVKKVIPNYKRLMEEGRIELTTTPFYHPILPLLCDSSIARTSMPSIILPQNRFRHPEDAEIHLDRAISYHEKTFGKPSKGMWPSEGSVSEEVVNLIASKGIEWIATDEEILEASAHQRVRRGKKGIPENPDFLYRPYRYKADNKDISIVFRDHQLSDLIGFVYSSWQPKDAANDFMEKLHDIRHSLGSKNRDGDHLVTVILDGENCWEHYLNDGWDFLTALYERVESDDLIEMVTVSEHLENHPPKKRLERIFPGSWINHNFRIWIGHEEDNLAWDYLNIARNTLKEAEKDTKLTQKALKKAWEHIYIAEGSDWCWWYGDEHSTENDADFDRLFRKNLINVYHIIEKEPPKELFKPIISTEKHILPGVEAVSFINPTLDGEATSYFEWMGAAVIELEKIGGTMHKASNFLSRIYYGFNELELFIRMDTSSEVEDEELKGVSIDFSIKTPREVTIKINSLERCNSGSVHVEEKVSGKVAAAFKDVLEFEVPSKVHGAKPGGEIECFVSVSREGGELERWPSAGYFTIRVPGKDFESEAWNVYA